MEDELLAREDGAAARAVPAVSPLPAAPVLPLESSLAAASPLAPVSPQPTVSPVSAAPTPVSRTPAADLALPLAEIDRVLREERAPEDVVTAFVHETARWVPGAEVASITAVRPGGTVTTAAASSDLAVEFDRMQYETGEGPCLTALSDARRVRVDDLHVEDDRWPRFSALAVRAELRSALALQLYAVGEEVGALNIFSRLPQSFDESSEQVALLFATHASLLLGSILRAGQLEQAVATRDVIGMAKGMVMARHRIDDKAAFAVLVRYSRDTNTKLRDVASAVVAANGSLPG